MSIQRAEELKKEWTDKRVAVRPNIPELRRFEGLTGSVKTVNMNCRLLVQFDTPADISWYDISPQYLNVVESDIAERVAAGEADSGVTGKEANSKTQSPAATPDPPLKDSGVSPLDQIRAQAGAGGIADASAAANPLDVIRQQSANKSAPSGTDDEPEQTSAGPGLTNSGSPLEQIRRQAAAAGSAPSGTSSSSDATSPVDQAAVSGSPLDQIRAQAAMAAGDDRAPVSEDVSSKQTSPRALPDASDGTADAPAPEPAEQQSEVTPSSSAPSTATSGADAEANSEIDDAPSAVASANLFAASGNDGSHSLFDQIREQSLEESGTVMPPHADTLFGQVRQQASADESADADSAVPQAASTAGSEHASPYSGVEDPVKVTYRGKKLPKQDDLKVVEGIGPRIAELFMDDGITTWALLAQASPDRLREILDEGGSRFRMHNPETWPAQAKLADEGKWQELEEYQDRLQGGREPDSD